MPLERPNSQETQPTEARLERIEEVERIKTLKQRYANYVDADFDASGFASLFTADGVWESNRFGSYHGRDSIHEFMVDIKDEMNWALHFAIGPVVEVELEKNTASGRWRLLELASMQVQGESARLEPVLITGRYEDDFRRIDGEWFFSRVRLTLETVCSWREGWVETPFI